MKIQEIKDIAPKNGFKVGKIKKFETIRAIQKTKGNKDCYATKYILECNQIDCLWRTDCTNAFKGIAFGSKAQ
jgi:hypothetical protein